MLWMRCDLYYFYLCFFFFKQKTAYEMRISDWSSDVCSSDLISFIERVGKRRALDKADVVAARQFLETLEIIMLADRQFQRPMFIGQQRIGHLDVAGREIGLELILEAAGKIGRASCRERVCQYV